MKGLEPIIATIILIAVVIGIGVIIFAWNQGFLKDLFSIVGESIEQLLLCSRSRVDLSDLKLEQDNITGKILNRGSVELKDIRIEFESQNEIEVIGLCGSEEATRCEKSNLTILPGKIVSFSVKSSYKPNLVSVLTSCPNVKDSVEFSGICLNNGESCSSNWQCCSGYCKTDYDNQPASPNGWCCNSDQCAHDGICYENGYETPYSPRQQQLRCVNGVWIPCVRF
jgi:archaellum component FlaF (FlaF/FlaG flagellin family)